jgi:hypothetical protein
MSERSDDTKAVWAFFLGVLVGVLLTAGAGGALTVFQLRQARMMAAEAEMQARQAAEEARAQQEQAENARQQMQQERDRAEKERQDAQRRAKKAGP